VKKLAGKEITTHGFRSSLFNWGLEDDPARGRSAYDLALIDRTIGHMIGAKSSRLEGESVSDHVRHYARKGKKGDPFLKRRKVVLREWAAYVDGEPVETAKPAAEAPAPAAAPAAPILTLVA